MKSQWHSSDDIAKSSSTDSGNAASAARGLHPSTAIKDSTRRTFLQMTMGGTAAGWAAAVGMELLTPPQSPSQSTLSPDTALQELTDGNKRFTSERLTACELERGTFGSVRTLGSL